MPGCIIPHTPIALDYWHVRTKPHLRLFFLSHCHADHMTGLSSTWSEPIFCSPITARLLPHFTGVNSSLVRPLELGTTHQLAVDESNSTKIGVTLLEAQHCPGAVIFVLDGYFGRVVYTGDFRFEVPPRRDLANDLLSSQSSSEGTVDTRYSAGVKRAELPEMWEILYREPIDLLYLDTTYWDCEIDHFPSREEAKAKILRVCQQHNEDLIIIAVRRLGKEEILVQIAEELNEQICLSAKRREVMQLIDQPDVFTDDLQARIRAIEFEDVARVYRDLALVEPTILIIPTALHLLKGNIMAHLRGDPNVYEISYSDHSSRQELNEFLTCLPPIKLIEPIVKIRNTQELREFCCVGSPPKKVLTPITVRSFMERQLSSTLRNRVGSSRAGVKTKPAGLKFVATPPRPNKSRDDAQILAGDREENIGESSRLQSVVDEVESNRKENETKAVSLLHENEDQNEVEILYVVTAANRPKKKRLELLT